MNQNEPFFLNLYIRDTEKPKTFVQSNYVLKFRK